MKIKLTEFWNSKQALAIHCDTKEKAKTLLNAFNKLGKKRMGGNSYLSIDDYSIYMQYTCYTNNGLYCSYDWYKYNGYTIYEFEDVDLEN